ncbi:Uncharacterized protein Adt_07761 [Abeliophyllum distichum]|uniref:Uncharacterized protein n=1 Tax=Abeliophyllum distichum TaxID=126358 RepID=A0ABD1VD50_9LAMI
MSRRGILDANRHTRPKSLRGILDANKHTRPNFLDWHHNLSFVLQYEKEKIGYVNKQSMPKAPTEEATLENVQAYNTHNDDNNFATYDACNKSHELEKLHEGMDAYTNLYHFK